MHQLKVIPPAHLQTGSIDLPPSKSIANRVLIMSALCDISPNRVLSPWEGLTLCDDISVLARLLQITMGRSASSSSTSDPVMLDVGAAGTAMRFSTAYLAVTPGTYVLTGTPRLQQRPIGILVDALRQLGGHIDYLGNEGFPPLRITGNPSMQGGNLCLDGGVSSQFISAILMIAPLLKGGLTLRLEGKLVSTPYLSITTKLMQLFGADVNWTTSRSVNIGQGYQTPSTDGAAFVEPDWTAASYWYELSAIASVPVFQLPRLSDDSLQGDRVCKEIFRQYDEHRKNATLFEYNFEGCPDLVQTLVVTCCMTGVPFCFTGVRTLRIKETDRISALQTELFKLGFSLHATDDSLSWSICDQQSTINNHTEYSDVIPVISTYHDHRMAMAFAPCAMRVGSIIIEDPDVVTKSYPDYWSHLTQLGFNLCYI